MNLFRNVFLLFITLMGGLSIHAQTGRYRAIDEFFDQAKKSTLLVVEYEDDFDYNNSIKRAVDIFWTFTPVEIIPFSDLHKYANDDKYTMLIRNNSTRVKRGVRTTDQIKSNHLAIYLCGKGSDLRGYTGADALVQYHFRDIEDTDSYVFKISSLVRTMQSFLQFVDTTETTELKYERAVEEYLNELSHTLENKILYVLKDDLPEKLRDEKKLQKYYKNTIQIADKETIRKAVLTNREDGAILHLDPRVKEIFVIGIREGRILYHAPVKKRGSLTGKDFSTISSASR